MNEEEERSERGSNPMHGFGLSSNVRARVHADPPEDWSDRSGWDRYHDAGQIRFPLQLPGPGILLSLVQEHGGRVWFPGCGTDSLPIFYAHVGCAVLATDISQVAIRRQREFAARSPETMFEHWRLFLRSHPLPENKGHFDVANHDFTSGVPLGLFDVVINTRAFQGLTPTAMTLAARHFHTALRPGGVATFETINVQGRFRDVIESSPVEGGFFLPEGLYIPYKRASVEAARGDPERKIALIVYGSG